MLLTFLDAAHKDAARALAVCRTFEAKRGLHPHCNEVEPCRSCWLDAYAATAAILLAFEEAIADEIADARQRCVLETALAKRKVDAYAIQMVHPRTPPEG